MQFYTKFKDDQRIHLGWISVFDEDQIQTECGIVGEPIRVAYDSKVDMSKRPRGFACEQCFPVSVSEGPF